MKKILLIDFYNLFIRCFTKNVSINGQGINLGAVSCTIMSIYSFLKRFEPSCVYICYEGKDSGYRRRRSFHDYKNGRKSPHTVHGQEFNSESSFGQALNLIQDLISCLPLNNISTNFLEADDVIAFLAKRIPNDYKKIIISTDGDYLQLINDNILVYKPTKEKEIGYQQFVDEFGIFPKNYLIVKAFIGDNSDNIKKIKDRLGIKTVIKLFPQLKEIEFNSIEEFINSISTNKKTEFLKNEIIENLIHNYKLMDLINLSTISSVNYQAIQNQALSDVDVDLTNFRIFLIKNEIPFNASESEFSFSFKKLNLESAKFKEHIRTIWQGIPVAIN